MATTYKSTKNMPENYTLRKQLGSITFKRQPKRTYTDKNEPFNYNEYLKKYYEYNAAYQLQNPQSGYNTATSSGGGSGAGSPGSPTEKGMPPWSTGTEYSYPGSPNITGKSTTEISWNIVREVLPKQYEVLKTYVDNPDTKQVEGQAWFAIDKAYLDSIFPFETQKEAITSIDIIRDPYAPLATKQEAADNIAYLIVSSNPEIGNRVANLQPGDNRTWNDLLGNPKEQASWSLYSQDIQFPIYILLNSEYVNLSKYDSDGLTAAYTKLQSGEAFSYQDAQNLLDIYGRVMTPENLRVIDSNKYYYSNIKEITNMSTKLQGDPFGLAQHQEILKKVNEGKPLNNTDMEFISKKSSGSIDYDTFIKNKTKEIKETNIRISKETGTKTTPTTPPKPVEEGKPTTTKKGRFETDPNDLENILANADGKALVDVFMQGKASDMMLVQARSMGAREIQEQSKLAWMNSSNPLISLAGLSMIVVDTWSMNPMIGSSQIGIGILRNALDETKVFQTWQDLYYQSRAGGSTGNWATDLVVNLASGSLDPFLKTTMGSNLALDKENPTIADIGVTLSEALMGAYGGILISKAATSGIPGISQGASAAIRIGTKIDDFLGRIPVIGRVFQTADNVKLDATDLNPKGVTSTLDDYDQYAKQLMEEGLPHNKLTGELVKPGEYDNIIPNRQWTGREWVDTTEFKGKIGGGQNRTYVGKDPETGAGVYRVENYYRTGLADEPIPKTAPKNPYDPNFPATSGGTPPTPTTTPAPKPTRTPNAPYKGSYNKDLGDRVDKLILEQQKTNSLLANEGSTTLKSLGKVALKTGVGVATSIVLTAPLSVGFLAWAIGDTIMQPENYQVNLTLNSRSPARATDRALDMRYTYDKYLMTMGTLSNTLTAIHPMGWVAKAVGYDPSFMFNLFMDNYGIMQNNSIDDLRDLGYWKGDLKDGRPTTYEEFKARWDNADAYEIQAYFGFRGKDSDDYIRMVGQYIENPEAYKEQTAGLRGWDSKPVGSVTKPSLFGVVEGTRSNLDTTKASETQTIASDILKNATDISQVQKVAKDLGVNLEGRMQFTSDKSLEGYKNALLTEIKNQEQSPFTIDRRDKNIYAPAINQERSNYFKKVDTPETIKWDSKYVPQAATYGGQGAFNYVEPETYRDPERPWLDDYYDAKASTPSINWNDFVSQNYQPTANFHPASMYGSNLNPIFNQGNYPQGYNTPQIITQPTNAWWDDSINVWDLGMAELMEVIEYDPVEAMKKDKKT